MRRRLLAVLSVGAMVAALAAGVAPASGAAGSKASYRHLDPGGPARFSEKVPVNLVFVGYERDQVRKQRFLAGLPSRYKPVVRVAARLRGHRAPRHQLHLRLRRHLRQLRLRAQVLLHPLQAGRAGAPDRAPAGLQRPAEQRPRGDRQPPHRRPDRRALAGRPPAGRRRHPPEHDLLRQLVRAAGLQVPRLHQDRRARPGHRLQLRRPAREPQADRLGRHHPRRRGERARQAAPGVVLRPVGRARVLDRQLERRRRRPGRRRRARLPHAADLGVHAGRLPGALGPVRRPGQGGPLRRHQPPVHQLAALPARR